MTVINIAFHRGRAAAPVLHLNRAESITSGFKRHRGAQGEERTRAKLVMVWRTNPASGRLDCRWVSDRGMATDEDVSCDDFARPASYSLSPRKELACSCSSIRGEDAQRAA